MKRSTRLALAVVLVGAAWALSAWLDRAFEGELRRASASVGRVMLGSWGVDAAGEGTSIAVPWGRFDVLLPCSGGRFLALTLALGAAALALGSAGPARKTATALMLLPAALLGNGTRVALLVFLDASSPAVHTALGLALFGAVALAVLAAAGVRPVEPGESSSREG